jgi:HSP20 family protein
MMITRWDPFNEVLSLRDAMSHLFEQAVLQPSADGTRAAESSTFRPALDVRESQDAYTVVASLPGVKPEDVNIQYQQGVLTIGGETSVDQTREEGTWHLRERRHGRFSRTISLPDSVNADAADARFEHGVLELRLPKAEETKPRRIAVHAGSSGAVGTPELEPAGAGAGSNGHVSQATSA